MWQQWEDEKRKASYDRQARAEAEERERHRRHKQESAAAAAADVSVLSTANVTNRYCRARVGRGSGASGQRR